MIHIRYQTCLLCVAWGFGVFVFAGFIFQPPAYGDESKDRPGMVWIAAGVYQAGSDYYNDESPAQKVSLDGFFIDKYEVSQKDFKEVMGSRSFEFRGDNLPAEKVTWFEARDFCRKAGRRLPTEAEWEKAARAGSVTRYYWGDEMDDVFAWHWDNSDRKTHSAGQKKPNAYGLYDMAGNVWEWVEDWYDDEYYKSRPRENPKSPFHGKYRVLRGGSFMDKPKGLRATRRNWDLPTGRFKNFGFRCAADGPERSNE